MESIFIKMIMPLIAGTLLANFGLKQEKARTNSNYGTFIKWLGLALLMCSILGSFVVVASI